MLSIAYFGLVAVTLLCHAVTLPVYAHMMLMTVLTIYIGSHLSLPNGNADQPQVSSVRSLLEHSPILSSLSDCE